MVFLVLRLLFPNSQPCYIVLSHSLLVAHLDQSCQILTHVLVTISKGMGSDALQICSVRETNADGVEVFNDEGSDFASASPPVFFKQK